MSNTAGSKPSNRSAVRFAVGTPQGPRGGIWRLWTHKNEVYLSGWSFAKDLKVSLHSSGDWRYAYTEEHVAKGSPFLAPGQDRKIDRWKRPGEFRPGATRAFVITVPSSEVTEPQHPQANAALRQKLGKKSVEWVPAAPEGYATIFTVMFSNPLATAATLPGWPGQDKGTRFVWRKELPNRESVWVVAHERPDIFQRWVAAGKRELAAGPDDAVELRRLYYGRGPLDGTRFYLEISGEGL